MEIESLREFIQKIVKEANNLKDKYISEKNAPVNYACIFCQDKNQYESLIKTCNNMGNVVEKTSTGLLFQIHPLDTVAGKLRLLKIRKPDETRKELGDADFTIPNFLEFKKKCLKQKEFNLIVRRDFEMIELMDNKFKVRAYFSNPPIDKQIKII